MKRNAVILVSVSWLLLLSLTFAACQDCPDCICYADDTSEDRSEQDRDASAPDTERDQTHTLPDLDDDSGDIELIGESVTINVGSVFPPGTSLRDGYQGGRAVVGQDGNLTLMMHPNGLLLLERAEAPGLEAQFNWDNATVYFVVTDRFFNGDPSNDFSYGRTQDGGDEVGTWHGGDFAGLTAKLDYIAQLGVDAIWITPPVEQVRGWFGGGSQGTFKHYAYHGYWALDFTRLDQNLGDEDELRAFVDGARERGIRVVFDVVMNHPGYALLDDLQEFLPEVLRGEYEDWEPTGSQNYHSWNDLFVNFTSPEWANWWGPEFIRATFPDHQRPGTDDLTMSLHFLPDFRTESTAVVTQLPGLLQRKTDTRAVYRPGYTVRDYLIEWHTYWVREFGIDGFRCDTVKHVDLQSWAALKEAATLALQEWKSNNPDQALDDLDFWMTGEHFPHGVVRDAYFDNGFDSLINFEFQTSLRAALDNHNLLEALYSQYANAINSDPTFNVLSYISSHDTHIFFTRHGRNLDLQYRAGTALLMAPGGVQIYYGDESARTRGPDGGEPGQENRSPMNWDTIDDNLLNHWRRVGQFRSRHVAVGAGTHQELTYADGYAFARSYSSGGVEDRVVVVIQNP